MRVGAVLPLGIGQADTAQHPDHASLGILAGSQAMAFDDVAQLAADAHVGVERQHRVLEHEAHTRRPNPVECCFAGAQQLFAVEANAAFDFAAFR